AATPRRRTRRLPGRPCPTPYTGSPVMKKPTAKVLAQMIEAAELRAAGLAWDGIAAKLGCDERSCRRWSEQYPEEWNRLLTRMEEKALRQAGNEAMTILRR